MPRPLGELRAEKLGAAASIFGIRACKLHGYPDGQLTGGAALAMLAGLVEEEAAGAELLLAFHGHSFRCGLRCRRCPYLPFVSHGCPSSVNSAQHLGGVALGDRRCTDVPTP